MKTISVRELQHNLSKYIDRVRLYPLVITKHGKKKALLIDIEHEVTVQKKSPIDIMKMDFIGMHAQRADWKNRKTSTIASELRNNAWYGSKNTR